MSKKRITTDRLEPGMVVCDFGARGPQCARLSESVRIESDAQIRQIRRFYAEVWIDTELGRDESGGECGNDTVPGSEAIRHARHRFRHTHSVLEDLLQDVRLGNALDIGGVREAVEGTIHSVLESENAMLYVAQLQSRDRGIAQKAVHCAILSVVLGRYLSVARGELSALALGALLHDIGMLGVDERIRNKPGPLSQQELADVQTHVERGLDLLSERPGIPEETIRIVARHHERFDGTGYPLGLAGRDIGRLPQIVGLVSSYVAITSPRPYAATDSMTGALAQLYNEAGAAWEPMLVSRFISCIGVYPPGSVVELTDGAVGVVVAVNGHQRTRPQVRVHYEADHRERATPRLLDLDDPRARDLAIKVGLTPHEYRMDEVESGTERLVLKREFHTRRKSVGKSNPGRRGGQNACPEI